MIHRTLRDSLGGANSPFSIPWTARIKIARQIAAALVHLMTCFSNGDGFLDLSISSNDVYLGSDYDAKISLLGLVSSMRDRKCFLSLALSLYPSFQFSPPSHDLILPFLPIPTLSHLSSFPASFYFLNQPTSQQRKPVASLETFAKSPEESVAYSLGVILAELLTGKAPVQVKPGGRPIYVSKLLQSAMPTPTSPIDPHLIDSRVQKSWPRGMAQKFAEVGRRCLEADPAGRATLYQALLQLEAVLALRQEQCVVCLEGPPSASLPCGHHLLCAPCLAFLRERGAPCPLCRESLLMPSSSGAA